MRSNRLHLDGEEVGNSALLERGDELVWQAEPGDGEFVRVPLEQPRPGLALVLVAVVAAEPEPLEGVLGEHRVGRGDGRHHAPPAPPERTAAEGGSVGERAAGGRVG
jgi:hypothetical protein